MLAKCANPICMNRFRYLREGKLFSFRGLSVPGQVSRNSEAKEHWWLCTQCAQDLTIRFDAESGIQVVPKTKFEMGACTHVASLYQTGMVESYCNRCGRFVAASTRPRPLWVAEEAHSCGTLNQPRIDRPRDNRILPKDFERIAGEKKRPARTPLFRNPKLGYV